MSKNAESKSISAVEAELVLVNQLKQSGLLISQKKIQIKKFKINYIEVGKGPDLLLIHGANIGWGQWLPNIAELAKQFHLIAIDLPGCGGSSAVEFRKMRFQEDYVDTMEEFIKKIRIKDVSIIGHSFGGAIAIKLAMKKIPVQKIILVDPLGLSRRVPGKQKLITFYPFARLLSKTALKPSRAYSKKFLGEPLVNKDVINNEMVEYFWAATLNNRHNHPMLFMNSLTRPLFLKPELLLTKNLVKIKVPVLVIMGEKDPIIPLALVKKVLQGIPAIQLKVFLHTGHVPPIEKSELFNQTVINYLSIKHADSI